MNHLFLIGIDKYREHKLLNCCVKDCIDIKDMLIDKYDFSVENTVELYDYFATNFAIQEQFRRYSSQLTDSSNLIVYFSGHGGLDKRMNKGFWIPSDAKKEDYTTWITNETILDYVGKLKVKHVLLICDSCFSRSILITKPRKSTSIKDAPDYDEYSSRWALTAGANECLDGSPGENSYFAEKILEILKDNSNDLRVSKLIELVKDRFSSCKFQKPQGYPLNDTNHTGGEFIFKVVNPIHSYGDIKGYKEILTLLKQYNRSADFKEIADYEHKSNRIGFQIFQMHDKVQKRVSYFLFLYERINQNRTYEYIKTTYPDIFKDKSLIILIPREKNQTNPAIRKQNIQDKFSPLNIYYVDDFIREECNPKQPNPSTDDRYLNIRNFVVPNIDYNKQSIKTSDFFHDWLTHEYEPIMVLKGAGGIGKTTFAKYVADKFMQLNPSSFVLYIDSSEIRSELDKTHEAISVYNFYQALYRLLYSNSEFFLNEDLFRINLDAGNFLLIIDGLDEVISKVSKFNVDEFLNSILSYTSDMGNGKVVITCRSYFWESTKFSATEIKTAEILPFNIEQTKRFFEMSFNNDNRKVVKALKIAEEFRYKDNNIDSHFHPYVLDVIYSLVSSEQDAISSSLFDSKILDSNVKNDYIIYKICYRERLRVEQMSVDEQVMFFSYWSIRRRGIIRIENFGNELKEAVDKHIDDTTVEAFKSHPFIYINNKTIQFRYDFFADYFKSIFISQHLNMHGDFDSVSEDFLKIVSENCWYGSSMISDIRNRVMNWTDDDILKCSDIIQQILSNHHISSSNKRKAISGLLNICLAINVKFKSISIEHNTYLLKGLFGKNNHEIDGLHIINMHSTEETIRFDFSNLLVRNAFIDSYQAFWKCSFNDATIFQNSHLLNLEIESDKAIPIPKENFRNCNTDVKFLDAFKRDELKKQSTHEQIHEFLHEFFSLFYSRGMLHPQTLNKSHKGREHHPTLNKKYTSMTNKIISFDAMISILKKEGVISIQFDYAEEKMKVSNEYKNDIIRFIKDGLDSKIINIIFGKIKELATK
ncbi:MAG: caspase family protein [Candidatus Kuenenia stuttgartiensis]|nr:caspase family protein [Candidatus Kuenenia stuttgartiensis]